jgi:hypothetical protein
MTEDLMATFRAPAINLDGFTLGIATPEAARTRHGLSLDGEGRRRRSAGRQLETKPSRRPRPGLGAEIAIDARLIREKQAGLVEQRPCF